MKKFFKRLLYGEKGAVSVFAILIIVPIFLLNALFIDTIRIVTAERQMENAIDTALRSTMAEFNEKLAAKGLFGYSGSQAEAQADFQHYLDAQFYDAGELSGVFTMVQPNIQSGSATASFDTDRNLVDLEVFEHQILESMKYQAPAQIGQEIFDFVRNSGFDSVTEDGVESVEELIESYKELFELAKKRNEKIDAARADIEKYINMLSEDGGLFTILGPPNPSLPEAIPDRLLNMEELIYYNERYHELLEQEEAADEVNDSDEESEEEEEESEEEREARQQEIENYENALSEGRDNHLGAFNQFHSTLKSDIYTLLFGMGSFEGSPDNYGPNSAMDYNDQMARIMDNINFDNIEVDEESRSEIEKLEKMILEEDFFLDIYNHIEILAEQFNPDKRMSLEEALAGGYASKTVVQLVDGFYKTIKDHVNAATNIKNELRQRYIIYRDNDAQILQDHLNAYEDSKELLEEQDGLEEKEEEADDAFSDLWDLLSGLENLAGDQDVYDELAGYIADYDAVNGDLDDEDPGRLEFIRNAFERFGHFIEFMTGFPDSFRNQLYVNEYIMANYGTSAPYNLEPELGAFLYETKQAQFITYGYTTAGANYLAFIRDIAMLLFVVKLIDLIIFEGGYAGPLGVLRAIVLAFSETVTGLIDLTTGNNVYRWKPLKISPRFNMTMPTFMRFFMIVRSLGGEGYNNDKMRRLQAAITEDTGVRLDENPSYIKATVTAEVDLLFIPALTHLIPNESGQLSGNTYSIEKTKVYSY